MIELFLKLLFATLLNIFLFLMAKYLNFATLAYPITRFSALQFVRMVEVSQKSPLGKNTC